MNDYRRDVPTLRMPDAVPTQQSRPGLLVTPVMLAGAAAAVVAMLFTVLFLLTRVPERAAAVAVTERPSHSVAPVETPSEQPASSAPTPSDPAPTGTPAYSQAVDPCTAVGDDLVRKLTLFPDKSQIRADECEWRTLDPAAALPGNVQFALKVSVRVLPGDLAAAQQQLLAQRQDSVLLARQWSPAGVGEESWSTLYTLEPDNAGPTVATVGARVSNAVIQVTYQRRVTEDPSGHLTKGAVEVAKAVIAKLGAGG
ncbi:hypothetical protein ABT294_31950 [Nonomuraea sp. NPDC000554]|uniref:hypothetical protein n=1 Tax=Nonomuraea sp. NPDC000554 TaxID=3154259 RepID=UPI0033231E7D